MISLTSTIESQVWPGRLSQADYQVSQQPLHCTRQLAQASEDDKKYRRIDLQSTIKKVIFVNTVIPKEEVDLEQ